MTITHTIPSIDLSPHLDPNSSFEEKLKVIEEVKAACSTYGFLQIKGHGVPLEAQNKMLESCKQLFDLPRDEKNALSLKNNPARRLVTIPPEHIGYTDDVLEDMRG